MLTAITHRLISPGSPFELISPCSGAAPYRLFRHAPQGLNGLYHRAVSADAHPCMFVHGHPVTFGDVLRQASAAGMELTQRLGVAPRDRVAIIVAAAPQWLASFIAVTSSGAVATLIEASSTPAQMLALMEATECVAVITDRVTSDLLRDVGDRRPRILVRADHHVGFENIPPCASSLSFDVLAIDPEQAALIAFTSGSVGPPKGVISSHRAVVSGMMNMLLASALASARNRTRTPLRAGPQTLPCSLLLGPLTHVSNYSQLLLALWTGRRVVHLPSWHTEEVIRIIARDRITSVNGAHPGMLHQLTGADRERELRSLASIGLHGAEIRPSLLAALRERLPHVQPITGYGMTETNGSVCVAGGAELIEKPRTSGPLVPSVEARIVTENGLDATTGAVGEIWLRGAMLMSGYCASADGLAPAQPGSWFQTGDYGHFDSEGFLYLSERRQEVLISAGRQVSCARMERLACESAEVDDAAALVMRDGAHAGKLIVAVVPHERGADPRTRIAERLTRDASVVECGVEVILIDRLPRTRSGKIDRRALRAQLAR